MQGEKAPNNRGVVVKEKAEKVNDLKRVITSGIRDLHPTNL